MKTILLTALLITSALPVLGQSHYQQQQQQLDQQRQIDQQHRQLEQQRQQIKRLRKDYDYDHPIVPLQPLRDPYVTDPTITRPSAARPAVSSEYISSQIQKTMANPKLSHAAKMRLVDLLLNASK